MTEMSLQLEDGNMIVLEDKYKLMKLIHRLIILVIIYLIFPLMHYQIVLAMINLVVLLMHLLIILVIIYLIILQMYHLHYFLACIHLLPRLIIVLRKIKDLCTVELKEVKTNAARDLFVISINPGDVLKRKIKIVLD